MLSCTDLSKTYGGVAAVSHLTLTFETGHVYAFLGPNGSGKTTFMKMAAGLVKPTSGEILFEGAPIGVASKARVAYMPTEQYFYAYMTGRDIGRYYRDFFKDFSEDAYNEMLAEMELNPATKARALSSGMMAKLKLAVTLARASDLIMLDEPLNGVDLIARDHILAAIRKNLAPHRTFIISSHLVDEMESVVTDAVFMKQGVCARQGDKGALLAETGKSLADLYREIYG